MKKTIIIIAILLITGGLFYWYQVRPAMIYNECNWKARENAIQIAKEKGGIKEGFYLKDDYDWYYKQCLRDKGIQ